jgi:hypothetical protein
MKRNTTLKVALGGYAAAMAFVVPGIADATKSVQGDDYSLDRAGQRDMWTCDKEADTNRVHADADLLVGEDRQVTDVDGANDTCALSAYWPSRIRRHRTCEEQRAWPDNCGSWQGTGV